MNQDNPGASAQTASLPPAEVAAQDLVLIYASVVPPQLEHWLRKRQMRMNLNTRGPVDPNEVRNSGARFVVLDLDELPREHAPIDTVRHLRIHVPEARLVVVTSRNDPAFGRALTDAGAHGCIIKQPYVADVVFALQAAGEGRTYITGQVNERERAAVQITAREKEVLELMAHGHSNQSIGERLSISVKTVEAHRARLFKKLGASNVADAVLLAIRTGLVMP
jgi:DNA-binding NarL/FixJ family response regulator